MSSSTMDRCPRCGATTISYGGGHMACCGGSNYWCDQLYCLRPPDRPQTYFGEELAAGAWYAAAEWDEDPRERDWHPLDAARMRAGISKAAEHFGQPIDVFYEEHDAGDADIAFQFAILGKIIYC